MAQYTEEQAKAMFADMEYNDRMQEYKFLYEKFKRRFTECTGGSLFLTLFLPLYEVMNSWDIKGTEIGPAASIVVSAICFILAVAACVKKLPETYLVCGIVRIIAGILGRSFVYPIIGLMEIAFFFVTHGMNEVKKLPGYPAFALRQVRK